MTELYFSILGVSRNGKNSHKAAGLSLLPIVYYSASFYMWATGPYSRAYSSSMISLMLVTAGLVFGKMTTKIILAHVTKDSFPRSTLLIVPMSIAALLSNYWSKYF